MGINQNREENGEFREVVSTMGSVASNIGHEVNRGAKELGSAVKHASVDMAKNLEQSGSAALEQIEKTATDATQTLKREITNSPLVSLGIAFGLGLVAARLLRGS